MALKQSSLEYREEARAEALKAALASYKQHKESVKNQKIIVVINMKEPSYRKRLHVYDLEKKEFIRNHHVAHGVNSCGGVRGKAYAVHFSNIPESKKSSKGAMVTGSKTDKYEKKGVYIGKHGRSLKLDGLEPQNSNVRKRYIVIHAADYVTDKYIMKNERAGCSYGCPAVDPAISDGLIDLIKDGVFVYVYG